MRSIFISLLFASTGWTMGTESFGYAPLSGANYVTWPNVMPVINDSHRVYHSWVNGSEHFYFDGDTAALNTALNAFAGIKAERLTIVLRPAPGQVKSFRKDKALSFNWNLHLLGGIAKHMSTEDRGGNIWDPNPCLWIYVGGPIVLNDIEIPSNVNIVELEDLQTRYAECLTSEDKTVRGWSCGYIAGLDRYNIDSMRKIAAKLDDKDDWVKLNAAGALSHFSSYSEEVIVKLQAVKSDDKQLNERIRKSIGSLQDAKPDENTRKAYHESLESIHKFVIEQRNARKADR